MSGFQDVSNGMAKQFLKEQLQLLKQFQLAIEFLEDSYLS